MQSCWEAGWFQWVEMRLCRIDTFLVVGVRGPDIGRDSTSDG